MPPFRGTGGKMTNSKSIKQLLAEVTDPEIPVLSIMDMGVVRAIEQDGNEVLIKITPRKYGFTAWVIKTYLLSMVIMMEG